MSEPLQSHLALTMATGHTVDFHALLQQGFNVQAQLGCSLQELLCSQWGMDPDYVNTRITTIFMNSRATDNIATAIVREGAVIALSGAMPGLVGATMRRGGYYAAMRGAMTYRADTVEPENESAEVRVKLFNLLLPELGPAFLKRGVSVSAAQLGAFFRARDAEFWKGCRRIQRNGVAISAIDANKLCEDQDAARKIGLSVAFEG